MKFSSALLSASLLSFGALTWVLAADAPAPAAALAPVVSPPLDETSKMALETRSVGRMEAATHQNATLVDQTTASLAAVDQQIKRLFDLISFFDADGPGQSAALTPATDRFVAIRRPAAAAVRS